MNLDAMTFVITGGARGIGAATATLAADRGANVVVSDVRDEAGQQTVALIRAAGGSAIYRHCDVSRQDDVDVLMQEAAEEFGGIDVLHNNAGIHEAMISSELSFESMPVEVFDRVWTVNVRGAFLCSQAALPYLKQSKRGPSIINAGSTASCVGMPFSLAYGTSKGAVVLFTKNLAVTLAPYGIRANCYCPASVETEMVREVTQVRVTPGLASDPQAAMTAQARKHLVNRLGRPEEIANLVCFLASEEAAFVNGAAWLIDGGALAWRDSVDVLGMS